MDLKMSIQLCLFMAISLTTFALAMEDVKASDFHCHVCSNSEENGNPFYRKHCFDIHKMSAADKADIRIRCDQYDDYVEALLNGTKHPHNGIRKSPTSDDDHPCPRGSYNACRSFYYSSTSTVEVDVKNAKKKPSVGPLKDNTERVFRFCGCATKDERTRMKGKSFCQDVPKVNIRKRYCGCVPGKDGQPCNSARTLLITPYFILTLILSMFFNNLSPTSVSLLIFGKPEPVTSFLPTVGTGIFNCPLYKY